MNKQPERTVHTREDIMDAFCVLYKNNPIEKITVNQVIDLAGYNRSTFYRYFDSVYDILDCIEEDLLEKWKKYQDVILGNLSEFATIIADFYRENDKYLSALLNSVNSPIYIEKFTHRLQYSLEKLFGLDEKTPEKRYILAFYTAGAFSVITSWYKDGKQMEAERMAELIRETYSDKVFHILRM
ncbi:MAG: TetR/AcrR family transcriptional regulator [Firmicutes bacterium]|nr:TetR/AcrR family transcriptional regulator [Bacillota bacterium]